MVKKKSVSQKQQVKQVVQVVITDKVFGKQKRRGNKVKGRKRLPRRSRIIPQQHIRYSNQSPAVQSWYGMKDVLNRLDIKEAQGLVGRGRREQLEPALRAEQRAVREREERGFVPPQPTKVAQEEQYQSQLGQQQVAETLKKRGGGGSEWGRSEASRGLGSAPTEAQHFQASRSHRVVDSGAGDWSEEFRGRRAEPEAYDPLEEMTSVSEGYYTPRRGRVYRPSPPTSGRRTKKEVQEARRMGFEDMTWGEQKARRLAERRRQRAFGEGAGLQSLMEDERDDARSDFSVGSVMPPTAAYSETTSITKPM